MNKINFYDLMVLGGPDLNTLEDYILEELKELKRSTTGEVTQGLTLSLSENTLKIKKGFGFSSGGKLLELKEDSDVALSNIIRPFVIYLMHNKVNLSLLLNEPSDPYDISIARDPNVLVIGIVTKDDAIYELNRNEDSKNLAIGTVLLYVEDCFKDFYTIKGFKTLSESYDKFMYFSSHSGITGGANEIMLEKSQLPSITVTGRTESSGKHSHQYETREGNGGVGGFGDAWYEFRDTQTGISGDHTHSITLSCSNAVQKPIHMTPQSITLIPIVKVY